MIDYRQEAPAELRNFLTYMETIKGKSRQTCEEYYLDLRMFFRYILQKRGLVSSQTPFDEISIDSVDLPLIQSVTLTDVYDFLGFASKDRPKYHKSPSTPYGNGAKARARKVSALRVFFRYLTDKAGKLEHNPVQNLDYPKTKQALPRFLTLKESLDLLENIESDYPERDYCMITLFLNCGLRVSELVGLNVGDYREDTLRVLGKGNKERVVYLNQACRDAIEAYLPHRIKPKPEFAPALFISRLGRRISAQTVKWIVYQQLEHAGLGGKNYSVHKLRHTAATLMYQNGVDVRTLKEVLGHENLDTTMIYTHITDENLKFAAMQSPLANVEKPPLNRRKNALAEEATLEAAEAEAMKEAHGSPDEPDSGLPEEGKNETAEKRE